MSHAGAGNIGLYDPESLTFTFGCGSFDESALESVRSAFGDDLMRAMCQEAVIAGDEWRVRSDRFGRCLSQSEIIRVYLD